MIRKDVGDNDNDGTYSARGKQFICSGRLRRLLTSIGCRGCKPPASDMRFEINKLLSKRFSKALKKCAMNNNGGTFRTHRGQGNLG